MLIGFAVEIIILGIMILSGMYGYRKGFVSLALKPVKSALKIGASLMFCLPLSELICFHFVMPIMADKAGILLTPISRILSVILSFLLLITFGGFVVSGVANLLVSFFSIGMLGKANRIVGLLFSACLGIIASWIFCVMFDHISDKSGFDFIGGPIFRLFISINPFN